MACNSEWFILPLLLLLSGAAFITLGVNDDASRWLITLGGALIASAGVVIIAFARADKASRNTSDE